MNTEDLLRPSGKQYVDRQACILKMIVSLAGCLFVIFAGILV